MTILLRLRAAEGLWRTTGDIETTLPLLLQVWTVRATVRQRIARSLAEMGPSAEEAVPQLHAELARPRRHNAGEYGWSSFQVTDDEDLLRACTAALASITGA